jgi:hypothetical protein
LALHNSRCSEVYPDEREGYGEEVEEDRLEAFHRQAKSRTLNVMNGPVIIAGDGGEATAMCSFQSR